MALKDNAQVGLAVESTEGAEETLVAADYAGNRKESSHNIGTAEYDRELDRGTQTRQSMVGSMRRGGVSWTEEAVGGDATTEAPFHRTLGLLGFGSKTTVHVVTYTGTFSGDAELGDILGDNATEGSATAKGMLVYHDVTNKKLYLYMTLGDLAGSESMTNYSRTGSVTLTAAAQAAAGFRFAPESERDSQLTDSYTVQRRLAGQLHSFVGCRGSGGISMRQEEPLLIRAEAQGIPVNDPADDTDTTPRTTSYLTGVTEFTNPPAMSTGIPIVLLDGTNKFTPILTELDITLGNSLALRPTITDRDLYGSGHMAVRIAGPREWGARIDPEHEVTGVAIEFYDYVYGRKTFRLSSAVGKPTESNGCVVTIAQRAQFNGDLTPGDRDNIVTSPLDIGLYGTDDDELLVFHIFQP